MTTQVAFSAAEAQKRFESLPADIQEAIYSAEMSKAIQTIAQKNHLHIDQMTNLEAEASFVMLGFTDPNDFVAVLEERLPTDHTIAEAVARDVDAMLFQKIRLSLKKLHETAPAAEAKPAAQIQTARPVQVPMIQKPIPSTQTLTPSKLPAPLPPKILPGPVSIPSTLSPISLQRTDITLSAPTLERQKTLDLSEPAAQSAPAPKTNYKTDPYREPVE